MRPIYTRPKGDRSDLHLKKQYPDIPWQLPLKHSETNMRRKWREEIMSQPLQRKEWHRSTSSHEYEGKAGIMGGLFSQVRQIEERFVCQRQSLVKTWWLLRDLPIGSKSKETTRSIFFNFSNILGVNIINTQLGN